MSGRSLLVVGVAGLLVAWPGAASETVTYTYDAKGRLVAVSHSGTVNNNVQATYNYDDADNRTNVAVTGAAGSGGGSGGGASTPPATSYRTRYVFNGRFYVAVLRQEGL
jgi:YD repeat-containing protein